MKKNSFGLSFVRTFQFGDTSTAVEKMRGTLLVASSKAFKQKAIAAKALDWQKADLLQSDKDLTYFISEQGPVWILHKSTAVKLTHERKLGESDYSWYRDQVGSLLGHFRPHKIKHLQIQFEKDSVDAVMGALVGLDLAAYDFKSASVRSLPANLPAVSVTNKIKADVVEEAICRAYGINLARHLVNVPPNDLNPKTFADAVKADLGKAPNVTVDVWDSKKILVEKMNLLHAVGMGSPNGPCLVHIKYRPAKRSKLKPVAFVGKGITFDTGGLDIKPSGAMRLMKKDMGGAAAVFGLAQYAITSQYPAPLDFYLALAENSVDGNSMRPSDVFIARNGMSVEIDNTDAEGRLVLADALDVAVTSKDIPEFVIDVATLTGAIKVGLGSEIAGLFSNDDALANSLQKSGVASGDLNWRMPLYGKYFGEYSSPFADFKNSGGGFGGAITAALFLEKFVKGAKWAHLDIYAWADKPSGAIASSGGSGQAVQCLIEFLNSRI